MNVAQLRAIQQMRLAATQARSSLIFPNPIEATGRDNIQANSTQAVQATRLFSLIDLANPAQLGNAWLQIRIQNQQESNANYARPNAQGIYAYNFDAQEYGQVMAYHSLTYLNRFFEALGFTSNDKKTFYVLTRANDGGSGNEINAYYERISSEIKFYGEHTAKDGELALHEGTHRITDRINPRLIDAAGEKLAVYSEGKSLHECLADMGKYLFTRTPRIGKWLAKSLGGYPLGAPIRSAIRSDKQLTYARVTQFSSRSGPPDAYDLGELCTQALWEIQNRFVQANTEAGDLYAAQLFYSALALLPRDASMQNYHAALLQADEQLFCGGHSDAIEESFQNLGFTAVSSLNEPLEFQAVPVQQNGKVTFRIQIRNSNDVAASNVRIYLSGSGGFVPDVYMQGLGTLVPGQVVLIGSSGGLSFDYSVSGNLVSSGSKVRIEVRPENGPASSREIQL